MRRAFLLFENVCKREMRMSKDGITQAKSLEPKRVKRLSTLQCKQDKLWDRGKLFDQPLQILSLCSPLFLCGYLCLWLFFYSIFITFLEYVFSYSATTFCFRGSIFFVGFNEFPSFVCWCTVIHHHLQQRSTLF